MKKIEKAQYAASTFNILLELLNGAGVWMRRNVYKDFELRHPQGKAFIQGDTPVVHVKGEGSLHPVKPENVNYPRHAEELEALKK